MISPIENIRIPTSLNINKVLLEIFINLFYLSYINLISEQICRYLQEPNFLYKTIV